MKLFLIIATIVMLSGCAGTKKLEVTTKPTDRPPLVLPAVDQFQARPVKWFVVTEDNFRSVVAKLKASDTDPVFFALTDDGYRALVANTADIQLIIRQYIEIIKAYRAYYEEQPETP